MNSERPKKAPYYEPVRAVIEPIVMYETDNLADYLFNSIKAVCAYLGISTKLMLSSAIEKDSTLKGQNKVLAICLAIGATEYYNAIGGKELYNPESFAAQGIQLQFLRTGDILYRQGIYKFIPNLSIIDVMMYNSEEQIQRLLTYYTLE